MEFEKIFFKSFDQLDTLQLYKILQLRSAVFVVEQNCIYPDLDDKDQMSYHLWMEDNEGHAMAYGRILPPGVSYQGYSSIGRIVSSQKYRKEGRGRQICGLCVEKTHMLFPDFPIKISAQSYLLKFYESFGFEAIGSEYLEDEIPHQAMVKKRLEI
ncbi:MAG: GNAT family N-acetyltransferase [Microgenomates group bacterium]